LAAIGGHEFLYRMIPSPPLPHHLLRTVRFRHACVWDFLAGYRYVKPSPVEGISRRMAHLKAKVKRGPFFW
jgi:hypothetical protein